MTITLTQETRLIQNSHVLPGVAAAAAWVQSDMHKIFGQVPEIVDPGNVQPQAGMTAIIYATLAVPASIPAGLAVDALPLADIRGKREVYALRIVDNPLPGVVQGIVIIGSDKRGTIYGLLHLSELMGVSPFVNWSGIVPEARQTVVLTDRINMVSKEPSVKYRGFFINDEWPAFGTWSTKHFGGANAAAYAQVFELLLRLKGNYFWPAMWKTNFNMEGPGLASAALADKLGVVMSTSHHEPAMRAGEEYGLLRGPQSPYGDDWNFLTNEAGITRFWRDGLRRNHQFENVYTMGMRGEHDTPIMAAGTLQENIDLLRRVLKVQNQLMREEVNPDLRQVPRQLVSFNEVQDFLYGDQQTPGLIDDAELADVTIMLSDSNVGYMRVLPSDKYRYRAGGWGMYYHIDMHGGPMSYEWIGSTALSRIWDQMSTAYDANVREIWIVNAGDIATQELPLAYFLDMAYDMDRYGSAQPDNYEHYYQQWVTQQFGAAFKPADVVLINDIIHRYLTMLERRKHEIMNAAVYHPEHFGEADALLADTEWIITTAQALRERCPFRVLPGFVELVYYPAVATANLMRTWILSGKNHLYAHQNRLTANHFADLVVQGIQRDRDIVADFHTVGDRRFDGFGLSEHFGFRHWAADDNQYPVRHYITPAALPRMIVAIPGTTQYNVGSTWIGNRIELPDFQRLDVTRATLVIAAGSQDQIHYAIDNPLPWLHFSQLQGMTESEAEIYLTIDRTKIAGQTSGIFYVHGPNDALVEVVVLLPSFQLAAVPDEVFVPAGGIISMNAAHYTSSGKAGDAAFRILEPYGKTGSAVKVYPNGQDYRETPDRPWVAYHFYIPQAGQYTVTFCLAPTNPITDRQEELIGYRLNDGPVQVVNTVQEPGHKFTNSDQWVREAQDDVKQFTAQVNCQAGLNTLTYYAVSGHMILEKIILVEAGRNLPKSYLGPTESVFHRN